MKVDESNYDLILRAEKETMTDYYVKWFNAENVEGYIEDNDLWSIIEDLLMTIDGRNERIEELENDIRDNYKPISLAEQYEVSNRDFI